MTMPAGVAEQMLVVWPMEERTPRWTDTVEVTLRAGTGSLDYTLDPQATAAGCYLLNDDLTAYLGDNGSDNQIFSGDGGNHTAGQSLVPLVLDAPSLNLTDGDELTLVDEQPTEANVWTESSPGEGDEPILGVDSDGDTIASYTWTYGVDSDFPTGLTTLYVEPTNGSANLNDIYFAFADSDANATLTTLPQDGGGGSPMSPPSPPPPAPATHNQTTTNGGAGSSISLTSLTPGTIIVGEPVTLVVTLHDPRDPKGTFPPGTVFTWGVPGRTVEAYIQNVNGTTIVPIPSTTTRADLTFYWIDAGDTGNANQGVNRTVSVNAVGLSGSVKFTVVSPVASVTATIGSVQTASGLGQPVVTTRGVTLQPLAKFGACSVAPGSRFVYIMAVA